MVRELPIRIPGVMKDVGWLARFKICRILKPWIPMGKWLQQPSKPFFSRDDLGRYDWSKVLLSITDQLTDQGNFSLTLVNGLNIFLTITGLWDDQLLDFKHI